MPTPAPRGAGVGINGVVYIYIAVISGWSCIASLGMHLSAGVKQGFADVSSPVRFAFAPAAPPAD